MAGSSDSASSGAPVAPRARPNRPWLGFGLWFASGPVLAMIWLAISYRHMPQGGLFGPHMVEFLINGMNMLLLGAAMAALAVVGAIVHGALTRSLPHCLIGLLLGMPAGLVLLNFVHDSIQSAHAARKTARIEAAQGRFAGLIDIVEDGDHGRIDRALRGLPADFPMPNALCALGGGEEPGTGDWLTRAPGGELRSVDTNDLFKAARSVVQGDWPREQKQAALYAVLRSMAHRDQDVYLREWTELWRGTQADPTSKRLVFDTPRYPVRDGACRDGDDLALAKLILGGWHDLGLAAWLDAGFGFTDEQTGPALAAIRTPAALQRLRAAGVDPQRVLAADPAGGEVFGQIAFALPSALDQSEQPAQQAELIETYAALIAAPQRGGGQSQNACSIFERGERWRAQRLAAGHSTDNGGERIRADTPQRKTAAARIHAALCKPAASRGEPAA
ncbi:hypothetical protein [Pseudomonas sp. CGJS7]|uniref:hypothetical protein n=1 Tax=Pseudomonas sp. CGJS7 TaxID=3109348 RepID=UPI00300B41B5